MFHGSNRVTKPWKSVEINSRVIKSGISPIGISEKIVSKIS